MSKIYYGRLTIDNVNAIIAKSRTKSDGVYSFRGIIYKVLNHKVTHFGLNFKIYQFFGTLVTQVGTYSSDQELKSILKKY